MTHEEKIAYMNLALSMMKFNIGKENLDKVVSIYELIQKKEGNANIKDICKLEAEISKKYNVNIPPTPPSKHSTKSSCKEE